MGLGLQAAVRGIWERAKSTRGGEGHVAASAEGARKTSAATVGFPFLSAFVAPGSARATLPRATPANLRRLAETPMARKAINTIKDRIACMHWQIEVRPGAAASADAHVRAGQLRAAFEAPNASDSFRTLMEQLLEDVIVGGNGAVELELTGEAARPVRLYPVDGASIEVDAQWDGDMAKAHYAQRSLVPGAMGLMPLLDEELMFVRLNPRTYSPFGLGKMEVAFEAISQFLEAHRYAGRLASNSASQYALWMADRTPEQHERLVRWWQDAVEGTGHVPVLSSAEKPEVLRFAGGTDAELRLQWQEFLLRMIANAFDLPAIALGVSHDVNRSTASELQQDAFKNAIVPLAKLIAEHITRDVIAKRLGWDDLRFVWSDLESRDELIDVEIQVKLLGAGVYTVDEVRAMRGLGPVAVQAKCGDGGESAGPDAETDGAGAEAVADALPGRCDGAGDGSGVSGSGGASEPAAV